MYLALLLVTFYILTTPSFIYPAFSENIYGTRSAGMAGAFTAIADDADTILVNPAGLAKLDELEFSSTYNRPYVGLSGVDLSFTHLNFAFPITRWNTCFGISVADLSLTNAYRENVVAFATAIRFGWASPVSIGITTKYLYHQFYWDEGIKQGYPTTSLLGQNNFTGKIAVDLGTLIHIGHYLSLGIVGRNVNRPNVGLSYVDTVPAEYILGLALHSGEGTRSSLAINSELVYRDQVWGKSTDKLNWRIGAENWNDSYTFCYRLGYDYWKGIAAGFTIRAVGGITSELLINYALLWSLAIKDNLGSHYLSLSFRFTP